MMRLTVEGQIRTLLCVTSLVILVVPGSVLAQSRTGDSDPGQLEVLRAEILEVRQESQREIDKLRVESERKIQELLSRIEELQATREGNDQERETLVAGTTPGSRPDRLHTSGDFRLRYEDNSSLGNNSAYSRGVIRGRISASYQIADGIKLGARLVTGDKDNPRTSDATIGDFARDLEISLDQLYAEYRWRDLVLLGGKFPKPFLSSELVWDGDINPQGLSGRYTFANNDFLTAQFTGVYFAIDENTSATKSDMVGGQVSLAVRPNPDWKLTLGLAYYDYDFSAVEVGLPGGSRGNNTAADGVTFVSDFNLLDSNAIVDYLGFGERWPLQLVANYVNNRGAKVPEDSGYGVDIFAGHLKQKGAFKLRYGYSQAETDAVLGLFANDNTSLSTNYRLHTLSADYALSETTFLGLTYYRFRNKDDILPVVTENDWSSRTRLNLYFTF